MPNDRRRIEQIIVLLELVRAMGALLPSGKAKEIMDDMMDDDRLTETIVYLEEAKDKA